MATTLAQYGTGSGLAIGAGVGATAASIAGITSEFAVIVGFGVVGGLVVGGFAGRFTEAKSDGPNWQYRVVAYTVFVSLLAGSLLGSLTAWMVDAAFVEGGLGGGATGCAFGLLMSGILISTERKARRSRSPA